MEDLRRGAGLRKLPPTPTRVNHDLQKRMFSVHEQNGDSLEDVSSLADEPRSLNTDSVCRARKQLPRSHTFNIPAMGVTGGSERRRKLPQIPPASYSSREHEEDGEQEGKRSIFDSGFIFLSGEAPASISDHSSVDTHDRDSGCASIECEETSVDGPVLLPKRNKSNFLWVDFDPKEKSVTRRPKNHDRLVQAKKKQHRHSAPPGSLHQGTGKDEGSNKKKRSLQNRSSSSLDKSTNKSSNKIPRSRSDTLKDPSKGIRIIQGVFLKSCYKISKPNRLE